MEKPKRPQEPNITHYPLEESPSGVNIFGEKIFQRDERYIKDYHKYRKDLEKYNSDMEIYEQIKLIRLVKNSSEKYCLKALKISRK
jgi:hypothetical protein